VKTGEYHHRITLQHTTGVTKVHGKPVPTWATYGHAWASVDEITATETLIGLQLQERCSHVIRLHYRESLKATHRALHGGRTFSFLGLINPDGKKRELLIAAQEIRDNSI
jgi:SPP1 family predicted phage head-tail adaptor